ncbi:sugar phosphate isomerase/epimerase [Demequina sp. NBRC 110053]|uniref:sugar phosphate isomerase/epimerase family protein n=1 Tax=Demequina sp. NBRC 110053 TaxID=1570342 RepID=UPI00190EA599|nr:sugar phosphate isomerase/epimerase family protein [Demequina sp. NBRC 110053]
MTPPPFTLGYGTNGFADHPLSTALDLLEAEGYGAVALTVGFPHVDPFDPDWKSGALRLRERLAGAHGGTGMAVVIETGTRFLLDPRRKHRPTLVDLDAGLRLEYMARAIELAAILDARCVSFFSGVLPADVSEIRARSLLRERMPPLLDHAHDRGVVLSLEPEPGMVIETVGDALELRHDLGGPPGLGVTVDVGHCLVVEPGGPRAALEAAGPVLTNVQLDDMPSTHHEHRPFGEGDIDLPLVLSTLADVGYTGVAAVELPRHSHDAAGLAQRSMEALTDAWQAARPLEEER